jgi:hypothetical protein
MVVRGAFHAKGIETITDDLRQRIERAAQVLKEHGAREVYLFGSAAKGKMREKNGSCPICGCPVRRRPCAKFRARDEVSEFTLQRGPSLPLPPMFPIAQPESLTLAKAR